MRGRHRRPTVSLLPGQREDAAEQARREVLRAFVDRLRRDYAHLWPEQMTPGVRATSGPWPDCWEQHPGFVAQLQFLLDWHTSLETGDAGGGYLEAADWHRFLEHSIVASVHAISQRICKLGHRDPANAVSRRPVSGPAASSLRGRAQRRSSPPGPPPPPHWSDSVR